MYNVYRKLVLIKKLMNKSIAFVFPYNTWGGAYRSTYILANHLVDRGWHVDIIFPIIPPRNGYKIISLRWLNEKFTGLIRSLVRRNNVNFLIKANLKCIPWISKYWIGNYDYIIANHWNTVNDIYILPERCGSKFHYIRDIEQWAHFFLKEIDVFKLNIKKIVVSSWIKDFLNNNYSIKVDSVITNGTDIKPFELLSPKPSLNQLTVGMCYGEHPIKGCEYGLEAISIASKERKFKVILFGYKRPQRKLDFSYEWIQSPIGESLREVYRKIHIFISSSIQEGFHNPPREAMAAECSVIATDVGCIPDIGIDNENVLKVPIRNSQDIADKIINLCDDRSLLKKISINGFSTIKNESWEKRVDLFEKLLLKYQ